MEHAYITYFDINYAVKGLAMLRSLLKHDKKCSITVICLDKEVQELLQRLNLQKVRPVCLPLIENEIKELDLAKGNRSKVEYYWTLTSVILLYFLKQMPKNAILTYVDSDLFFFSNPDSVFEEMGEMSVLIHGHNFPDKYAHLAINGFYNVGLTSFRNDSDGLKVLEWWQKRCLEWCYNRQENGKMGDQKYLEFFHYLTNKLAIAKNPGIGIAPWNYMQYKLCLKNGEPYVNNTPAVFFHYHACAYIKPGVMAVCANIGYPVSTELLQYFAAPYLESLDNALAEILSINPAFNAGFKNIAELHPEICLVIKNSLKKEFARSHPVNTALGNSFSSVFTLKTAIKKTRLYKLWKYFQKLYIYKSDEL